MTNTPPTPPFDDDAATEDQIGLAVRAVGAAFATAIAWLALIAWGTLQVGGPDAAVPAEAIAPNAAHVNLLLYGFSAGLAITGLVGWLLLKPVGSVWRRGALSMVGVLGGISLGMGATFLAREWGGSTGLVALAIGAALLALLLAQSARKVAQRDTLR